jgi:hypothetical protein
MGLGELDYAATFAVEMLPLLDQTGSVLYLPQLAELYRALHRSKLRSDPQALRLGLYLHKHGAFLL